MASAQVLRASSSRAAVVARPARSANASRMFVKRTPLISVHLRAIESESAEPQTVSHVNDDNFQKEVLESDVPVLVDFWAPWCGPCRFIAPIIDELAKDYGGRLKVVKLDTDKSPTTATSLGIRSIPTVILFKGGEKMDSVIGAVAKDVLVKTIDKFL